MLIKTETTISFLIPDEWKEADRFREENDMREWICSESTQAISYTRTQTVIGRIEKDDVQH